MYDKLTQLLELLSAENYKKGEELAAALKTSERTVRTRIRDLNIELEGSGASVVSKPRYGYLLVINEQESYHTFLADVYGNSKIPVTADERFLYLLAFLLNHNDYIKLDDLAEFMYISKNTLTADLKRVEKVFSEYGLRLERKPNYGICVQGDEFCIRLCMEQYFLRYHRFQFERQEKDLEQVGQIALRAIQEQGIRLAEVAFQNLVNHIYIALKRSQKERFVQVAEQDIKDYVSDTDIRVGRLLARYIQEFFDISFPESEVNYIILHLAGKKIIGADTPEESNFVAGCETEVLVSKMLELVYHSFKLRFQHNLPLRISLTQHLVPLGIRLRFGIPNKNPLLEKIREKYMMAYIVAAHSSAILTEHYQKTVPDDEIGYLALIFALAIEEKERTARKQNVLIVCGSGKGSAQLLLYRYRKEFGQYLDQIYDCSVYDLDTFDFSKVDCVFTTVPIRISIPVPIFEINVFLEHQDIEKVKGIFELGDLSILDHYYSPQLFVTDVKGETKEEVLRELCGRVSGHKALPEGFYDSVMKREHLGQTDFGNLVAMPHPLRAMTEETFVCVAILEKPIFWTANQVQIVFLVSVSEAHDDNLQVLYQRTIELMMRADLLDELLEKKDYHVLMKLLCVRAESL